MPVTTLSVHDAERVLADVQHQHQTKQVEVARLTRDLMALDKEPETWTPALVSESEANRRNWTKARTQAQQGLHLLARDVESATATLQVLRARLKELPGLIERLTFALSPKGNYGVEVYKAEQTLLICQQNLAQQQQRLRMLEGEHQALAGE